MARLSEHDRAVLNCVFNPHLPLEEAYDEVSEDVQGTWFLENFREFFDCFIYIGGFVFWEI